MKNIKSRKRLKVTNKVKSAPSSANSAKLGKLSSNVEVLRSEMDNLDGRIRAVVREENEKLIDVVAQLFRAAGLDDKRIQHNYKQAILAETKSQPRGSLAVLSERTIRNPVNLHAARSLSTERKPKVEGKK